MLLAVCASPSAAAHDGSALLRCHASPAHDAVLSRSDCTSQPAALPGLRSVCSALRLSPLRITAQRLSSHASPMRNARLPFDSGWSTGCSAPLRSPSLRSRLSAPGFSALLLRTVRDFLYTFPCVSLRDMKETGDTASRFHPCAAIYAMHGSLSRPITDILRGSYLVSEQSPASSQTAPQTGALI